MLEPPIALQSTWHEELAQLDTISSERIGKMRRMDFGRQRKGLHRRTKGCVFENNEIWSDFLGVDEVILGEELRRRADAIERVKTPDYCKLIERTAPNFIGRSLARLKYLREKNLNDHAALEEALREIIRTGLPRNGGTRRTVGTPFKEVLDGQGHGTFGTHAALGDGNGRLAARTRKAVREILLTVARNMMERSVNNRWRGDYNEYIVRFAEVVAQGETIPEEELLMCYFAGLSGEKGEKLTKRGKKEFPSWQEAATTLREYATLLMAWRSKRRRMEREIKSVEMPQGLEGGSVS
ncbi:uncharacterized protein EMH_0085380 [Eimeria mitis]|uniref:Uncharacterized protein n=1 Tax=Eimeria mitis TaxID=44415 RepID=U6KEI9_9EIME|nr:uncharacterized protein EMH_0085380 [Eimeria mitis]CDJ36435.1 hypothetical protein, conserved [Eimeria mitis]